MSRTSSLDHVNNEEFIKIVQEMKPEIGGRGGRKFVRGKDSYTMNQLTKKFQETKGSARIGKIIYEKDREATEMLKKASCLQKWLTKIKQNWGNSRFKTEYPLFVGKEAVFRSILAMRQVNNPPPIVVQPPVVKEPEPVPVKVEPKKEVKEEVKQELTPEQKELNFLSGKDFEEALAKVSKDPNAYYELLEENRKNGFLDRGYLRATILCQEKIPKEYLKEIFTKLVYNACKEAKDESDYLDIRSLVLIAADNRDTIYFEVVEIFIKELNWKKAMEVMNDLFDKTSELAQRLSVDLGMAYIDQLKEGDEKIASQDYNFWVKNANFNRGFKRFGIVRDASIVAAKILWKQEKRETALQVLSSIAVEFRNDDLRNYLARGGKDFDHALKIAKKIEQ